MKVVMLMKMDSASLAEVAPGIEVISTDGEDLLEAVEGAEAVIGGFPEALTAEVLRRAPGLRWVHVAAAGVDKLDLSALASAEVMVTCGKGEVVGPLLAEHAFALMLSVTRGVALAIREGCWNRPSPGGQFAFEVAGRTMGIVGYGGTGEALATRASAFGMRVVAVRRQVRGDEQVAEVWSTDRLGELLECADVVVNTLPATAETERLFDEAAFARMRQGAVFINVGRGKTVATAALVRALESGRLAGAGLDVVDPEPLPDDHPLWGFPNVVITPHFAGNSPERGGRNRRLLMENLRRFHGGEALIGLVDFEAGY